MGECDLCDLKVHWGNNRKKVLSLVLCAISLALGRVWLSGVKKAPGLLPCPARAVPRLILAKIPLFFFSWNVFRKRETGWTLLSRRWFEISYSSAISVCLQCLFKVNRTFFPVLAVPSQPWISLFFNLSREHSGLKHPELPSVSFLFCKNRKKLLFGAEWELRWFSWSFPVFICRLRVTEWELRWCSLTFPIFICRLKVTVGV